HIPVRWSWIPGSPPSAAPRNDGGEGFFRRAPISCMQPAAMEAAMAETKKARSTAKRSTGDTASVGILGASGYTGAELVRLLLRHPKVSIKALTADRRAGQTMSSVFGHFAGYDLPKLVTIEEMDASNLDLVFCALPHGTTQLVIKGLMEKHENLKIV